MCPTFERSGFLAIGADWQAPAASDAYHMFLATVRMHLRCGRIPLRCLCWLSNLTLREEVGDERRERCAPASRDARNATVLDGLLAATCVRAAAAAGGVCGGD